MAIANLELHPKTHQSISLQFGAAVALGDPCVRVGGIARFGVWSAEVLQPTNQPTHCSLLTGSLQAAREDGCSYGWKFGGITPPLTHDEAEMPCCIVVCTEVLWQIDSGLSFGDVECHLCGQVATKITIQQLMVQTTENESESESGPADANRFAEVSTLQKGSI